MTESDDILKRISATEDTIYGLECSVERMQDEYRIAKIYEMHVRQQKETQEAMRKRTLLQRIGLRLRNL